MSLFQTPPLTVIDLPAAATHTGASRPLSQIRGIILHSTEGTDSRSWLSATSDPPVSAHRLIRRAKGEHYKILSDTRIAWHAGSGKWGNYAINDVTVGWELERTGSQTYTEYQMDEVAALTVEAWGRYGFIPIMSHGQIDPWRRSDPVKFDWADYYRRVWLRLIALGAVNTPNLDALRHFQMAAGHIEAGMGDLAAGLAALK